MPVIKPRALRTGDRIAVVSPAGPVSDEGVLHGLRLFEEAGFQVDYAPEWLFAQHGYLAGNDASRLQEFNAALNRPDVAAVVCARGGYGTTRILDGIDVSAMKKSPKILVGFSDITALHLLFHKAGLVTFHGPMVDVGAQGNADEWSYNQLLHILTSTEALGRVELPPRWPSLTTLAPGTAMGTIVGGNLSLICATMGTPYELDFTDKLVLLEDVGESPYRIDRYLTQLRLAGKLQAAAGFVIGESVNCENTSDRPSFSLIEVLKDLLGNLGVPVVYGYPYGHGKKRGTVPLGVKAKLDGASGELEILEPHLV